jgi:RimJ/RimL family protein N-acetyltransferase
LGKVIVDWAEAQTALFGYSVLRLDCEAKNTKLCQFYEKIGFKLVGTREVPEYGDYVAALYERPVVK